jgi:hypothetical protein
MRSFNNTKCRHRYEKVFLKNYMTDDAGRNTPKKDLFCVPKIVADVYKHRKRVGGSSARFMCTNPATNELELVMIYFH